MPKKAANSSELTAKGRGAFSLSPPSFPLRAAKGRSTTAALLALFCCSGLYLSTLCEAQNLSLNPLMSYRQQLNELTRWCLSNPADTTCPARKKALRETVEKLRAICSENPKDERCSYIMRQKKEAGWMRREFCSRNPHNRACARKRERIKIRAKQQRKFCAKNPDKKRCMPAPLRPKRGFANLAERCKARPESLTCQALKRKSARKKRPPPEPKLRF